MGSGLARDLLAAIDGVLSRFFRVREHCRFCTIWAYSQPDGGRAYLNSIPDPPLRTRENGANGMTVGDLVVHTLSGRVGRALEFLQDGDAYVEFTDRSDGNVNWNHLRLATAQEVAVLMHSSKVTHIR